MSHRPIKMYFVTQPLKLNKLSSVMFTCFISNVIYATKINIISYPTRQFLFRPLKGALYSLA